MDVGVAAYVIPTRVRIGITRHFNVSPSVWDMVDFLQRTYAWDSLEDLVEALDVTGQAPADATRERLHRALDRVPRLTTDPVTIGWSGSGLGVVMELLPDSVFVAAIDYGVAEADAHAFSYRDTRNDLRAAIDRVLAINGVPYGFNDAGKLAPTGSRVAAELTLIRAYDALEDQRLSTARVHLIEAVQRLREHDPPEAVDEARQAIEAGMLALLDARQVPRPAKHQPQDLFVALVDGQVLTRAGEEIVLATARFRGRTEAGHVGGAAVDGIQAEAAVGSAAAALLFLSSELP